MAHYLIQLTYTTEAWAAQLRNPQDRREVVRPLFERLGGRIEAAYFAFGEYDLVVLAELPDNIKASAFALTVAAGEAVKAIKTTPLVTIEEGLEAMRQAAELGEVYRPPQGLLEDQT